GARAVATPLPQRVAQQQDQQQRDDHHSGHRGGQQPLPALGGGHLQGREFLLGLQQRDLLFLEAGVEFDLQVGQPPLARVPVGDRGCFGARAEVGQRGDRDRKSTRLNSSHVKISYAVFCLKKKKSY